jgi:hypothetical protein
MIEEKIILDFVIRLYFDRKDGYYKAGLKRAYLDFNRTLHLKLSTMIQRKEKKIKTEEYLESELVKMVKTNFETQTEFDIKHRDLCENLKLFWNELTIGHCQKWINMTLKYWLVFGNDNITNISNNYKYYHLPIDSIIQKWLIPERKLFKPWSKINNYEEYFEYQNIFRNAFPNLIPIEKEFEYFNTIL